ncbi:MAG TPA: universal stress protein, partial [Gemmatimonadales bacterium]|nr:universal stress protein [Gemmatimonadales bacterium]
TRFAEAALPAAARLARKAPGRLHLLLAHQPTAALVGPGEIAAPDPGLDRVLLDQEENYLAGAAASAGEAGVGIVTLGQAIGPAGGVICEEADRIEADLIVMATHGRSALGRFWLGSVSSQVVRDAAVPVLLVHPNREETALQRDAGAGILVALDLSRFAEAILEPVVDLAKLLQAHVTLLHVVEPNYHAVDPLTPYALDQDQTVTDIRRADAQRRLDEIADRLRARGLCVAARVTVAPNAAVELLETLEVRKYDLLAMTTHGAGGLRHLLSGSVADKVIRSAGKPVLVLRP